MKLLVILCILGVCCANPRPGFRYAYTVPQAGEQQPWTHFDDRGDDHYSWGYEYPGRLHFESKDDAGVVKGSFGYVDPNGSPVVWKYVGHPTSGFEANTGVGQPFPQMASLVRAETPVGDVYASKSEPFPFEDSLSPLLKQAASTGEVRAVGNSPSGVPQYAIDPQVADAAGGVSALAERYGAVPVAAVHDVQRRPSFGISESAFAPVLVHQEEPEFTLYTLEVPIQ